VPMQRLRLQQQLSECQCPFKAVNTTQMLMYARRGTCP
jgi:hypothetical protein